MILCLGTTPALQRTMVFGSLVISAVNRALEVFETPAGKSVNVAKVLKSLARPVMATGFLGGQRGQSLRRLLDQMQIAHDFVEVESPTRLCITLIDKAAGTHTELVEESSPVRAQDWQAMYAKLSSLLSRAQMLVMSGTLPPGAPADFYGQCVRMARETGIPAILDAHGQALLEALPMRPAVVKPNREELARSLGMPPLASDAELCQACQRLVEKGARAVVATLGADGALATDGQQFWRIYVPRLSAVNSIGSGDAFTAGLAAALLERQSFPDACRLGAACGAANTLTLLAGEVHPREVQRLLLQVAVKPLRS